MLRLVQFLKIYISQGSAATRLECGEIFDDSFIADCPHGVPVKDFSELVNIWRRYGHKSGATFFMVHGIVCGSYGKLQA